jgi:hypothetical protein
MSKYNKVNPGIYTQRGRLTPDDTARELRKQRALRPARTWQTEAARTGPPSAAARDAESEAKTPAGRPTRKATPGSASPASGGAKAATGKKSATKPPRRTAGDAQTGKAITRAKKPARKAVPSRSAGGRRARPRHTSRGKH